MDIPCEKFMIIDTSKAYASPKWEGIRCSEALASCGDKSKMFEGAQVYKDASAANKVQCIQKSLCPIFLTSPMAISRDIRLMKCEQSFINFQSRFGDCIFMRISNFALCIHIC